MVVSVTNMVKRAENAWMVQKLPLVFSLSSLAPVYSLLRPFHYVLSSSKSTSSRKILHLYLMALLDYISTYEVIRWKEFISNPNVFELTQCWLIWTVLFLFLYYGWYNTMMSRFTETIVRLKRRHKFIENNTLWIWVVFYVIMNQLKMP